MQLDSIIDALQEALRQELSLLSALTPEQYRRPSEGHFTSSVGAHLRHNLDHFEAFFRGVEGGQVDYESRSRSSRIEDLSGLAEDALRAYIAQLDNLRRREATPLQVREESEAGARQRRWLDSSVGRELQFLLGHTVHHNAIIAMIVDRHGLDVPGGFGVAPSTQRHQAETEPLES